MYSVERQQAIGVGLIFVLLLGYFLYSSSVERPAPLDVPTVQQDTEKLAPVRQSPASDRSRQAPPPGVFASGTKPPTEIFEKWVVETEDLELHFTSQGGLLQAVRLKKYYTFDQQPLWIIDEEQSSFDASFSHQGRRVSLSALHFTPNLSTDHYKLAAEDTLSLDFVVTLEDGGAITQHYRIPGQGYHVDYEVNGLISYAQNEQLRINWTHSVRAIEKDLSSFRQNTVLNYYLKKDGLQTLEVNGGGQEKAKIDGNDLGWVALKEKFFLLAWLPNQESEPELRAELLDRPADNVLVKQATVTFEYRLEEARPAPGYRMYFGPNEQRRLSTLAPGLSENVALGWGVLSWINQNFFAPLLYYLLSITKNYGLVIVVIVVVIRLILAPLTYRSYISMAKMKLLKPEIDAIKAEYANDTREQQSKTMQLYQQTGINPLSGCIPLILQMPVLFSMFYFFPNMIDFRQASFLWADDLSTYDSILNLPFTIPAYGDHVSLFTLLMTASTILYTMFNTQMTTTPQQMKAMQYILPVIFLFFLNSYSAGLTFYYFSSNVVSTLQQILTKHFIKDEKIYARLQENKQKNKDKKPTSFQRRLEGAMKEQRSKKISQHKKKK